MATNGMNVKMTNELKGVPKDYAARIRQFKHLPKIHQKKARLELLIRHGLISPEDAIKVQSDISALEMENMMGAFGAFNIVRNAVSAPSAARGKIPSMAATKKSANHKGKRGPSKADTPKSKPVKVTSVRHKTAKLKPNWRQVSYHTHRHHNPAEKEDRAKRRNAIRAQIEEKEATKRALQTNVAAAANSDAVMQEIAQIDRDIDELSKLLGGL